MKTLLLITAVFLAFVLPVQAQQYGPVTLSVTNTISANGTNSPAIVIPSTKHLNVAIQPTFALTGAGTGNVTFNFQRSIDNIVYETTPSVVFNVAATGNTTVTGITNVNLGAVGYLRLSSIVNANGNAVTNLAVKVVVKPGEN